MSINVSPGQSKSLRAFRARSSKSKSSSTGILMNLDQDDDDEDMGGSSQRNANWTSSPKKTGKSRSHLHGRALLNSTGISATGSTNSGGLTRTRASTNSLRDAGSRTHNSSSGGLTRTRGSTNSLRRDTTSNHSGRSTGTRTSATTGGSSSGKTMGRCSSLLGMNSTKARQSPKHIRRSRSLKNPIGISGTDSPQQQSRRSKLAQLYGQNLNSRSASGNNSDASIGSSHKSNNNSNNNSNNSLQGSASAASLNYSLSSFQPGSTSTTASTHMATQFSTQSFLLAQQFLHDDDDDHNNMLMNTNTAQETFQDEYNSPSSNRASSRSSRPPERGVARQRSSSLSDMARAKPGQRKTTEKGQGLDRTSTHRRNSRHRRSSATGSSGSGSGSGNGSGHSRGSGHRRGSATGSTYNPTASLPAYTHTHTNTPPNHDNDNESAATSSNLELSQEWNPDLQRLQHEHWKQALSQQQQEQQQQQQQPSSSSSASNFPTRPDLRHVDQSVNINAVAGRSSLVGALPSVTTEAGYGRIGGEEDSPPPSSRRLQKQSKRQGARRSFMVDIFLGDNSSAATATPTDNESFRRGGSSSRSLSSSKQSSSSYRKRRHQLENSRFCQNLWCSRITVLLLLAAVIGVLVAWRTGAFAPITDNDVGDDAAITMVPTTITAAPLPSDDSNDNDHHNVAYSTEEETIRNDLKELLLKMNLVSDPDLLEPPSTTEPPLSPQYLALHWVSQLNDPSVLSSNNEQATNHKLSRPEDEDTTDSMISTLSSDDCLRLVAYALAVLYYSTNNVHGDNVYKLEDDPATMSIWYSHYNWLTPSPICHWQGIQCETNLLTDSTVVSHLNLTRNNLVGTLPDEVLQVLFSVKSLDLSHNHLEGALPSNVTMEDSATWNALEVLSLENNQFVGTLPASWGSQITNLAVFNVGNNQLTGTLPTTIDGWTQLKTLAVDRNQFTGKFPYIEKMTQLEFLIFFDNHFSEGLPYSFFRIPSLIEIRGQNNNMVGTIPPEIDNLRQLKIFRLEENELTGHLSNVFDQLTNLEEIHLQANKLGGSLPATLGSLTKLDKLLLDNNQFTSTLPSELSHLTALRELRASDNKLTGNLPAGICTLKDEHQLKFLVLDCEEVKECTCCDECL